MKEAFTQSLQNLRANKLRSFLTMFGILWGMISVVILSAMGEGFRRGNDKVLRELGQNIGIIWGGRTSMQAGGERAGRRIFLTLDDARATAPQSAQVAVPRPAMQAGARGASGGAEMADQLFGKRHILNEPLTINGLPFTVVGRIRKKEQDSDY